jgi:hypothetical protein
MSMDNKDRHMRFISLDQTDLRIEALAPEKNNAGVFHAIHFRASEISYLMEVNDKVSALVLKSNVTIPVALPHQQLDRMIYEPDFRAELVLDLKPVTGKIVKDVPELADEFNTKTKFGLAISAILRRGNNNTAIPFDFFEDDIKSYEPVTGTRSKTTTGVKIVFNPSVNPPFGKNESHHLDMPYEDFIKELFNAKAKKAQKLDLCALFVTNPTRYGFDPE